MVSRFGGFRKPILNVKRDENTGETGLLVAPVALNPACLLSACRSPDSSGIYRGGAPCAYWLNHGLEHRGKSERIP